jgi:hypothetical protein
MQFDKSGKYTPRLCYTDDTVLYSELEDFLVVIAANWIYLLALQGVPYSFARVTSLCIWSIIDVFCNERPLDPFSFVFLRTGPNSQIDSRALLRCSLKLRLGKADLRPRKHFPFLRAPLSELQPKRSTCTKLIPFYKPDFNKYVLKLVRPLAFSPSCFFN